MCTSAASIRYSAYIVVMNKSGQHVGFSGNGLALEEIPASRAVSVNDVKVLLFPAEDAATIQIKGITDGTMNLFLNLTNKKVNQIQFPIEMSQRML